MIMWRSKFRRAYIPNVNYKIRDFCIENSGITVNMVERMLADPLKNLTDEESCYVHCAFTESGFLTEDAGISLTKFQMLKELELPEVDLDCLEEIGKIDYCNEMMKLRRCYV
nr:odorant binding protein 29 [Pagiophloeus tsushimanus]